MVLFPFMLEKKVSPNLVSFLEWFSFCFVQKDITSLLSHCDRKKKNSGESTQLSLSHLLEVEERHERNQEKNVFEHKDMISPVSHFNLTMPANLAASGIFNKTGLMEELCKKIIIPISV